jgi:hypothetical protein
VNVRDVAVESSFGIIVCEQTKVGKLPSKDYK